MAVLEELILTVSTLQECVSGLERTDFNSFYIGKVWQSRKKLFYVSTLRRCGSLEKTDFNSFYFGKVCQS